MYFTGRQYNSRSAWRVIKRCDNLYSGEETLMRFINYFRSHHWPYARFSSRMCTCAICPKTHCFVFLWFSTTYCWCVEHCFPMHSEDRNDRDQIEHMLALILAIDVRWSWPLISLNISPPIQKKVLGNIWLYYFRGAFNTLWQNVWSRGTNCLHRLSKMTQAGTLDADVRTAWLVLNLKTLVDATSMGVSNALHYLNEL